MPNTPIIGKNILRSSKSSNNITGFETLLNLISEPAIIVDKEKGTILASNPVFIRMVGFPEEEIVQLPLSNYIFGIELNLLIAGENYSAIIKRRNRTSLPVTFVMQGLDTNENNIIILIKASDDDLRVKGSSLAHDRILEILLSLLNCTDERELNNTVKATLEAFGVIIGTKFICLYQAQSNSPVLKKIVTCEPVMVFPAEIPSTDLIRLSKPTLWSPGVLVQTEVHKAGRISDLKFVASTPLGQEGALSGLLVIGATELQSSSNLKMIVQFVGNLITTRFQHFILDANLRERIDKIEIQNNTLNELFNAAQEGILILQPDSTITNMNTAAELMLGYAEMEVQGEHVENILIGPDGLIRALEKAIEGIPIHNLGTISIHRRNGQSFPANLQIIPVIDEGLLSSILVFISDVSHNEQIKIRTQQLEHRAVLGEFTAVFAHEVRNPINNISTGLQLLGTLINPDDPNQDIINRMLGDCNRLNHLMESVLAFSRPLETKFEPLELPILLQRILDRWRPRLAKLNVEVFYQPAKDLPKITGDMRSLEQVFTNLIGNAVEIMSKTGGTLAIRIQPYNDIPNTPQVEVAVSDNGPGIPDEIKERIFEPFISNNPRGTGLGLAITKRIVTAHRGSIKFETFPGGTVFRVYLPAIHGDKYEYNHINS